MPSYACHIVINDNSRCQLITNCSSKNRMVIRTHHNLSSMEAHNMHNSQILFHDLIGYELSPSWAGGRLDIHSPLNGYLIHIGHSTAYHSMSNFRRELVLVAISMLKMHEGEGAFHHGFLPHKANISIYSSHPCWRMIREGGTRLDMIFGVSIISCCRNFNPSWTLIMAKVRWSQPLIGCQGKKELLQQQSQHHTRSMKECKWQEGQPVHMFCCGYFATLSTLG